MTSEIKADKWSPASGTAGTIGDSGDTFTAPTGVGLTVTDEVKTNKISPATGTAFTLGDSGDTFTIPSGVTLANSGTATGFSGDFGSSYFAANRTSDETHTNESYGKIGINNEIVDAGGNFDTTNYRYTAPATGYYYFYARGFFDSESDGQLAVVEWHFKKNNSSYVGESHIDLQNNNGRRAGTTLNAILSLSSGDYIEWWAYVKDTSGNPTFKSNTGSGVAGSGNQFGGWRVA